VTGPGGSSQSQTVTDLNGRWVPLESAEERVLSDGPEGRVVERLVKKFDSQGRLTGQEKVRVEATSSGDGSSPSGPRFTIAISTDTLRANARRPSPARTAPPRAPKR